MESQVEQPTETSFQVGDMAVHPAHGVGEVTGIEKRDLGGSVNLFYTLKIVDSGLKVMIPVSAAAQVGLRRVMSKEEADKVLRILRAPEVAVDLQPWNRRFRAYTEMLKTGSPYEIAKVLRDMYRLKSDKDLSFGERRLLDQAKSLLLKELALAKQVKQGAMEGEIRQIFSA
jgi:CarD family transcriptional regulator